MPLMASRDVFYIIYEDYASAFTVSRPEISSSGMKQAPNVLTTTIYTVPDRKKHLTHKA
jgi:hypothetical protein